MQRLDPHLIYPAARFFLDFVRDRHVAGDFFQHTLASLPRLANERRSCPDATTRAAVSDALLDYNRRLGASDKTLKNIEAMRDPESLCVIGGQQAGFLGGPLFVVFKIATILCIADDLRERLAVPVLPVFWLATEDHDFDEINRVHWVDPSGRLKTVAFEWSERGRPIEHLPITPDVRRAYDAVMQQIPSVDPTHAAMFAPESHDTYGSWHGRIWSRLFAGRGLALVEPYVLRPLAGAMFARARTDRSSVHAALADGAAQLRHAGYPAPLDVERAGTLFTTAPSGVRHRLDEADSGKVRGETLSPDAALRPLFADALLPTAAQVLGPSELAYHAMLRPLYERWSVPQPVALARHGGTVLSRSDAALLADLGVRAEDLFDPDFASRDALSRNESSHLRTAFEDAGRGIENALAPLRDEVTVLDPGLDARWRQTLDQCRHHLSRFEDRAVRADLARRGISAKRFAALRARLLPANKPQERVLSAVSVIAAHGVEWIRSLIICGEPDGFIHHLIVLKDLDDPSRHHRIRDAS